jgi:tRNA-specific 2-thiouridylase
LEKIVLGLSGGVDSAVAARLLQQGGYTVFGLYLDNGTETARKDAEQTAAFLGIPLKIVDIREALERNVCVPFAAAYLRGETPNPCVLCNPTVKFQSLLDYADAIGAPYVATGHYARAEQGALYKGMPANDQSYMLCRLTTEQVARLRLPLGGYEKEEVRALAQQFEIPVAEKPDSMEICFIPDKDYIRWIEGRTQVPGGGNFVFNNKVIGQHDGIHCYTVGQRYKELYHDRRLYVSEIRPETNTVVLCLWEDLFSNRVKVRDMNWLIPFPKTPIRAAIRVRHTKWENPMATVTVSGTGFMAVTEEPLRAPAPGQAAALYDGDRLLGGGYIV